MRTDRSSETDLKGRWLGVLEHPVLFLFQKSCLDSGYFQRLADILRACAAGTTLDVCCGLGEFGAYFRQGYVGLDNSLPFLRYARAVHPQQCFIAGDAAKICFSAKSFDAVFWIGSAHHFRDAAFAVILNEMARVSRRWIIVDDAVRYRRQPALSRFLYSLDRGLKFRTVEDMENLLKCRQDWEVIFQSQFKSRPGLYTHAVFVLQKNAAGQWKKDPQEQSR